jgi:hypothetical protein
VQNYFICRACIAQRQSTLKSRSNINVFDALHSVRPTKVALTLIPFKFAIRAMASGVALQATGAPREAIFLHLTSGSDVSNENISGK